jgi:hypothetical protein
MKITMSLSEKSIDEAIKKLKDYKKWVETKTVQLTERLALIGAHEASVRFATAIYDGTNDSSVEVSKTSNGWVITASGQAVCFIEFGSGVYHNSGEPYPLPRPVGISGIGEYGQGKGKQSTWGYYGDPGTNGTVKDNGVVLTHGNPASMPMWYASTEMQREVTKIAREVFKT